MEFLHPNIFILADYYNKCVKRVDVDTGDITGYLSLPAFPWDITTLGLNQAAVTLPDIQGIHAVFTKLDSSLIRTIKVDGECHGICSTIDNTLVITFINQGKVPVLDEHGTVLCEMERSADSKVQLNFPHYVLVVSENDNDVIYVSDQNTHTPTKFSLTGQILLTYRDNDLKWPHGFTVTDDGHVLICGWTSNNFQVASRNGKKVRTLLCKENSIVHPNTVGYNVMKKTVYVGCYASSNIESFKLQ